MRQKWNNLPLRKKMSFAFIALYTVLLAAIIIMVNLTYRSLMDRQIQAQAQYEEQLMLQQLEKFSDNVTSCCNNVIISLNTGFRQYPGAPYFSGQSVYEVDRMFLSGIRNNLLMFSEAGRISVVLETGKLYTQNAVNLRDRVLENTALYNFFAENQVGTKGEWFYGLADEYGEEAGQISFVKSLRDTQTNLGIGYVVISIDADALQGLYINPYSDGSTHYSVFAQGDMLLTPGQSSDGRDAVARQAMERQDGSLQNGQSFEKQNNSQYFASMATVGKRGDWTLVSVVDRKAVMQSANLITAGILVIGLLLLVVANFIIAMIAKRISNPLQTMAEHMVRRQNSLPDELPDAPNRDEIGVLTDNFNAMIRQNQELLDRLVEEQKQKQHYELALLQTQIKPHFLYNTLDAAYCLAGDGQAEDAKKLLKLLADYYRAVLNKGAEWISVGKELESVKKYLEIQQIRYTGLFRYEIDTPPDICQLRIPKLTLQPLVENAIYHGLKPLGTGGLVQITGEMQKDWAIIRIRDNGIGFPQERFQKLLKEGDTNEEDGFGLKNIHDRLGLFYGPVSHLALEPAGERGTVIAIHIYLGLEDGGYL